MRRPLKMAVRFFVLSAVVMATVMTFAPVSQSPSHSPYLSALSDLAAAPALAAKKHCPNTACEFVAPAHACLDGGGTKCLPGCVTQAC
ncbi:MAG: hypothetical protein DMF50_06515 [Acidobacteria bacterium]|nr:MAG: hypothetical protein DMF50_07900 [Acidobacteriota bacterium]PYS95996.1 MAG: hypothetical protein DMF50_06515 [Acidobacteriota bacterium]